MIGGQTHGASSSFTSMVWPPTFAQGKTMRGRRRGACVLRVPSVAKSQHPGARRAARAQGRKTVVRKDRTSPSTGRHYCSTGSKTPGGAGTHRTHTVPLFPEKHRGEDTHGKHGAHGHGSQLGGTVSNNPASKVLQVFSLSRFTVNKKDQSELVGSAPGRSTGCRVCRVTVHRANVNSAPKTPDRRTYRCG